MNVEKLVYMANQIGAFFRSQGESAAVAGIADHIAKFWDPRMRDAIYAHAATGGEGLQPLVLKAIESLKAAKSA
jgi:formate dehydrogenase subunit delta